MSGARIARAYKPEIEAMKNEDDRDRYLSIYGQDELEFLLKKSWNLLVNLRTFFNAFLLQFVFDSY